MSANMRGGTAAKGPDTVTSGNILVPKTEISDEINIHPRHKDTHHVRQTTGELDHPANSIYRTQELGMVFIRDKVVRRNLLSISGSSWSREEESIH